MILPAQQVCFGESCKPEETRLHAETDLLSLGWRNAAQKSGSRQAIASSEALTLGLKSDLGGRGEKKCWPNKNSQADGGGSSIPARTLQRTRPLVGACLARRHADPAGTPSKIRPASARRRPTSESPVSRTARVSHAASSGLGSFLSGTARRPYYLVLYTQCL